MGTATNRFEALLPIYEGGTPEATAIETFKTSMYGLVSCYFYPSYDRNSQSVWTFFGYVTNVQASTALGFLGTLNTSLQAAGKPTVTCVAWLGTNEP